MRPAPARVGDAVDTIDTPALVVDLDAMERNLAAMAAFARSHGMRLRPHAKMHKCAAIAKLQIAAGAVGVCVQKVGEAQALVEAGIGDVYVSNVVVAEAKLARFAALAGRATMAIAVDSALGVDRLARALAAAGTRATVFVEVDVGHGRCGVPPTAAGALAHQVVAHGLPFGGLQAYHGSAQHLRDPQARAAAIHHAASAVRAAQAAVTAGGLPCPVVTGAGTGTFVHETASGVWNELQCGSYLFLDRDYADNHPVVELRAPAFEQALFLKSRVVSRGAGHAVIDAGHKSHALDSGPPRVHGRELAWSNGGDEHGLLRGRELPALDETVWLVPGHCDPTVNLHDHLVAVRGGLAGGAVEAVWPVDARGAAQ